MYRDPTTPACSRSISVRVTACSSPPATSSTP